MSSQDSLSPDELADAHLESSEQDHVRLVIKKPHPRDYGGVIFQSELGPVWAIGSQFDRMLYFRDSAAYWRREATK